MDQLLINNEAYRLGKTTPTPHPVPSQGLIILTCMDVRIDPLQVFGLEPGAAHVLRNAGARVTEDVVRSILVSYKLMNTSRVIILHHTECGLSQVTTAQMQRLVVASYEPAIRTAWGFECERKAHRPSTDCNIDFGAFDDQRSVIAADVYKLAWHPHLPPSLKVDGMLLDVETGKVEPVATYSRPGTASLI